MLHASLCAKIMVFRRITRIIGIVLNERTVITVRNLKSSLLSKMESTGLGHKNIIERYSLLCDKKVKIENAENFYSVSLPIIKKQSL